MFTDRKCCRTWALGALEARQALQNRTHFTWALSRAAVLSAGKGVGKTIPGRENSPSKGLEACTSRCLQKVGASVPGGQSPGRVFASVQIGKINRGQTEKDLQLKILDFILEAGSFSRRRRTPSKKHSRGNVADRA